MTMLTEPLTVVKGIGPAKSKHFGNLGVHTIADLLYYYPFRYNDYTRLCAVHEWEEGNVGAYVGEIVECHEHRTRRGMIIFKALLKSRSQGDVVATWFGRRNLSRRLEAGMRLFCVGRMHPGFRGEMNVISHRVVAGDEDLRRHMILEPVYHASEKLNTQTIAQTVAAALDMVTLKELLPQDIRSAYGLIDWQTAINHIHRPPNGEALTRAQETIVIMEFLALILWARTDGAQKQIGVRHQTNGDLCRSYLSALPYELTGDQTQVLADIFSDMESPWQMHRLLQGDVGCGKTSVAVLALLKTVESGHQGVLMAPTEILANQHYEKTREALSRLNVSLALLTGKTGRAERRDILDRLASGKIDILMGTHALLEDDVCFHRLGLAIIDEQHRFGVAQRGALENKGRAPDVLVMTATPIPRSLALTVYGDLSLSLIEEMPPGRGQVRTMTIGEHKRADMYEFLRKEMQAGRQIYVVCPLVQESEKLDLANATALAENLSRNIYPEFNVDLLHGQMKSEEKAQVMARFRAGDTQVLVSTTVIEVGIDVANATVMVIENAERFGLAQLHQLRGRIGRGAHDGYCILISEAGHRDARQRLEVMVKNADGFAIAEADLRQRGPGELLGLRQHGMGLFRLADPVQHAHLIPRARQLAEELETNGQVSAALESLIADMRQKMRT